MSWNRLKPTRPLPPLDGAGAAVTAKPSGQPLPRIDGYEVLAKIGSGGMATVYRARDCQTGAVVALKLLSPEAGASAVVRKRFEQEFQAARRLDHPNIVRTLDHGRAEAGPYLVMEFVEGESLGDRIQRAGPLPPAEAVRVVVEVAKALDYAHQQGLIHRDVKPDNILLTADGRARLTDFGLVKQLTEDVDLTRPGQGLGTLNFIAPEQLQNARGIDRRCDVYALGATLYMAVTGRCPFQGRSHSQVIRKKLTNELSVPRALMPSLSEDLDRIIRRAMHPDRGQRLATCAEFWHELTARGGAAGPESLPVPGGPPAQGAFPLLYPMLTDIEPLPQPAAPDTVLWRLAGAVVAGALFGAAVAFYRWGILGM